jgi:uncharacterized membrane protein
MRRTRLTALAGTCFVALVVVVTANTVLPKPVQIMLGLLMVFIMPGFAVVSAVLPPWQLSSGERLLASLGISLTVVTCAAVLLAATPIGLSRVSIAIAIGGITVITSICAWFRTRIAYDMRRSRESASDGIRH